MLCTRNEQVVWSGLRSSRGDSCRPAFRPIATTARSAPGAKRRFTTSPRCLSNAQIAAVLTVWRMGHIDPRRSFLLGGPGASRRSESVHLRLAGAEEERTFARLRGLRSDLIDPANPAPPGRIVKRTGDGVLIEFAAWSMPCAARSRCRRVSSSATPACRPTAASSFASALIWATSSRRLGAGRECFLLKPERT